MPNDATAELDEVVDLVWNKGPIVAPVQLLQGGGRRTLALGRAVRYVMEELPAEGCGTVMIHRDGSPSLGIEDISAIYGRLQR